MAAIIVRRLSLMLLTMLLVSVMIFLVSEVMPVDVARAMLGQNATPQGVQILREQLGLNCPAAWRYVIWMVGDTWIPAARTVVGESVLPEDCTPPATTMMPQSSGTQAASAGSQAANTVLVTSNTPQRYGILRGDFGYSPFLGV
jgi:hypothetical protein